MSVRSTALLVTQPSPCAVGSRGARALSVEVDVAGRAAVRCLRKAMLFQSQVQICVVSAGYESCTHFT